MSTKTNMGATGNGRAFEYLVYKLKAYGVAESASYAGMIQGELEKIIPAFLRRAKMEIGEGHVKYLVDRDQCVDDMGEKYQSEIKKQDHSEVQLVDYEKDGELKVLAALLYENSGLSFGDCLKAAKKNPAELEKFIKMLIDCRGHRTHKPPRAFEHTSYQFDILCDIGAYRDLQRHRILTQQRQYFSTNYGYIVPPDIVEAGLEQPYRHAFNEADMLYQKVVKKLPKQAQYIVPFGYLVRFNLRFNAREAYHLCELRSTIQGHPSYRFVAHEMARKIQDVHPTLGRAMMITWEGYDQMARAASEQGFEKKHGRN